MPRVAIISLYTGGHHVPYLQDLVRGLTRSGVRPFAIGPRSLANWVACETVHLRGSNAPAGRSGLARQVLGTPAIISALRESRRRKAEIVHFAYADWHLPAIAIALWLVRPVAAIVLTVHWGRGVGADNSRRLREATRASIYRWIARRLVRQYDVRWIVHHSTVGDAIKRMAPASRVVIAPYPARAPRRHKEIRFVARKMLGLTGDDKALLCFGGTRWDKGADLAVACLPYLPDIFKLIIAGEVQHFSEEFLLERAGRTGVGSRIRVVAKFLSEQEIACVFEACDYGFLPYRREFAGQSGPLLQLAAYGKPIAAADLPVVGETVQSRRLGLVFPPEDIQAMARTIRALSDWKLSPDSHRKVLREHGTRAFARAVQSAYR